MFRPAYPGMLVFGKRKQLRCPRQLVQELSGALTPPPAKARWIDRHSQLVDLFIAIAGLGQGLLDVAFAREGHDRLDATTAALDAVLRRLAAGLIVSWSRGETPAPTTIVGSIAELATLPLPEQVEIKDAEGYAFYALYPECYALAARALDGASPTVIGLRSIGLGLGAIVAARTQACLSLSLRPVGHPFERRVALADRLRDTLAERRSGLFAIVDEGPGLSGSSFAAVADMLECLGVARERIHVFPSHSNPPGAAATQETLTRWHMAPKHVAGFDELALETAERHQRLTSWVEGLTGRAVTPLLDIGAGRWRELSGALVVPPASPLKERRKFLLRGEDGLFLLRFAGLGEKGQSSLRRARILAGSGFTVEPLGLKHGFLVEPWQEDAAALEPNDWGVDRIAELADYLAFRALNLPAPGWSGATLVQLDDMRRYNTRALLPSLADAASLPALPPQTLVRRVETDNRMHRWEWLRRPDGRIIKTDAIDHCDSHDLIGCQDIGWDVIGAKIELDLSDDEVTELVARLRARGCPLAPSLLEFYESCYLAFQAASFYLDAQGCNLRTDADLLRTQAYRYISILEKGLL